LDGNAVSSEIGLASVTLHTSHFTLSQFTDTSSFSHLLSRLEWLQPTHILLSITSAEPVPTNLFSVLQTACSCEIVLLGRQAWNDADGREVLGRFGLKSKPLFPGLVTQHFFCLAALAALFSWIDSVYKVTSIYPNTH
jgi:hypothetical protein